MACQQKPTGICELWFSVVDAQTGQPIPNYEFLFPSFNGKPVDNSTLRRGDDFSVFFAPSPRPVTITISAKGYSKTQIEVDPSSYGASAGPISKSPQKILLKRSE